MPPHLKKNPFDEFNYGLANITLTKTQMLVLSPGGMSWWAEAGNGR